MQPLAPRRIPMCVVVTLLVASGCQSPQPSQGSASASKMPNIGHRSPDVRTEATILEMENWYNAEKNSQPTHHREAQEEAAKKAKAKAEAEKAEKKGP